MNIQNKRKLVVIGLDGSTFNIIDPYIKKGLLPNIEHLIKYGVKGDLQSTVPPVTGPAWTSFMTGMDPGRHGVFDFVKPIENNIKRRPITYLDIKCPTIWDYFNQSGKKVGVVNLPVTYPPPVVDGFFIPGLLTPNAVGEFAYPHGIMGEIKKNSGEYVFDVWWQHYGKKGIDKFLNKLINCTRQRIKTIFYLMDKKEWDFFMGVLIGTDRIQHYIWQYILPEDEKKLSKQEQEIVKKVVSYFKLIDDFFGKFIGEYKDKADLLIISDHGFGPLNKKIYINRWLEKKGYLKVMRDRLKKRAIKRCAFQIAKTIVNILDPFKIRKKIFPDKNQKGRMRAYYFLNYIDWSKTTAYSASNTEQGIYINIKGREKFGIIDEHDYHKVRDCLIRDLKEIKHPETGEPMEIDIYKREEQYHGPFVDSAPDIIVLFKSGEYLMDVSLSEKLYETAGFHTGFGTHRMNGILIGYGNSFKKGVSLNHARIIDIAPTIFHVQGMEIPEEMDGKPLIDMINEQFMMENPVKYRKRGDTLKKDTGTVSGLSEEEVNAVEEKLKGLGYM